jgi:hypothetical protein
MLKREKAMDESATIVEEHEPRYHPVFLEFFHLLLHIDKSDQLFPKPCRVCGTSFTSLAEYLSSTVPKGHTWEDCEEVMGKPFTMLYRHCTCGNTLVLTLTDKTFSQLRDLWHMLRGEAESSGRPIQEVVHDFAEQCDDFMLDAYSPPSAEEDCSGIRSPLDDGL